MPKSVLMGEIKRVSYFTANSMIGISIGTNSYKFPKIKESLKTCGVEKFHECEIDLPLLQKGDYLYIDDLNISVLITDVYRSTNNNIVYHTNHIIKVIENEESKKELEDIQEYMREVELLHDKYNKQYVDSIANKEAERMVREMLDNKWYRKIFKKGRK